MGFDHLGTQVSHEFWDYLSHFNYGATPRNDFMKHSWKMITGIKIIIIITDTDFLTCNSSLVSYDKKN